MSSTHPDAALTCSSCARKIKDAPVRVEEQYREVTHTYEGHPIETELRSSFAGVYCTIACAIEGLDDEHQRRTRRANLREVQDAA